MAILKADISDAAPDFYFVLYELAGGDPARIHHIRSECTIKEIALSYAVQTYHDCIERQAYED